MTTLLWAGGAKEKIIKDPNRNQADRSPRERAITPLPHKRIAPVWLERWIVGDENIKWNIGVNKDNNHDNHVSFQTIKRNQILVYCSAGKKNKSFTLKALPMEYSASAGIPCPQILSILVKNFNSKKTCIEV